MKLSPASLRLGHLALASFGVGVLGALLLAGAPPRPHAEDASDEWVGLARPAADLDQSLQRLREVQPWGPIAADKSGNAQQKREFSWHLVGTTEEGGHAYAVFVDASGASKRYEAGAELDGLGRIQRIRPGLVELTKPEGNSVLRLFAPAR